MRTVASRGHERRPLGRAASEWLGLRAQLAADHAGHTKHPCTEQGQRRRLGKVFRAVRQRVAGIGKHVDTGVDRDFARVVA